MPTDPQHSNAAEIKSIRIAANAARKAKSLKEWQLPNAIRAYVFPVSETENDASKSRIAIMLIPSPSTRKPRIALSGLIDDIASKLPEGLTVPKDRDMLYLSDQGEHQDTGAIIINPGKITTPVAIEQIGSMLKGMGDPDRLEVSALKRGKRRGGNLRT